MYNNILTSLTWIWGKSSIRKRCFHVSCGTFQTLRCFVIFCQELQNLGQQIREAVTAERFSEAQELKMRESEAHWRVACHEDLIRIQFYPSTYHYYVVNPNIVIVGYIIFPSLIYNMYCKTHTPRWKFHEISGCMRSIYLLTSFHHQLLAASPGDAALGADGPQPTQRDAARARHQRGRGPGIEVLYQNSSLKIFFRKNVLKVKSDMFFCKFIDVIFWKWEIINCESLYEHCMTIFLLRWNG